MYRAMLALEGAISQ